MKIINKIFIFIYYVCVILITLVLMSFVFDIVIRRLALPNMYNSTNTDSNTKSIYFYMELVGIWVGLICLTIWIKYNINQWSKKKITALVEKNGETLKYDDLYSEVDHLVKIDIVVIVGFLIVVFNSNSYTIKEKITLLNEDIGLFVETFI